MDEKLYKVVVPWESTHFVWASSAEEAEFLAEEEAQENAAMAGMSANFAEEIAEDDPEYLAEIE